MGSADSKLKEKEIFSQNVYKQADAIIRQTPLRYGAVSVYPAVPEKVARFLYKRLKGSSKMEECCGQKLTIIIPKKTEIEYQRLLKEYYNNRIEQHRNHYSNIAKRLKAAGMNRYVTTIPIGHGETIEGLSMKKNHNRRVYIPSNANVMQNPNIFIVHNGRLKKINKNKNNSIIPVNDDRKTKYKSLEHGNSYGESLTQNEVVKKEMNRNARPQVDHSTYHSLIRAG